MMRFINLTGFILALSMMSNAHATNTAFFDMGENLSISLVKSIWNDLGKDCNEMPEFLEIIGDSIHSTIRYKRNGNVDPSYIDGYQAGLEQAMHDTVAKDCPTYQRLSEAALSRKGNRQTRIPPSTRVPPRNTGGGSSFFKLGKNLGIAAAVSVWQDLGENCKELKFFLRQMKNTKKQATKKFPDVAPDFRTGYKRGISAIVHSVRAECKVHTTRTTTPKPVTNNRHVTKSKLEDGKRAGETDAKAIVDGVANCNKRKTLHDKIEASIDKLEEYTFGMNPNDRKNFLDGYMASFRNGLIVDQYSKCIPFIKKEVAEFNKSVSSPP